MKGEREKDNAPCDQKENAFLDVGLWKSDVCLDHGSSTSFHKIEGVVLQASNALKGLADLC